MALADYRLCDICGRKTFYDANLNYDDDFDPALERPCGCGDWVAICVECAKAYEVKIVKKDGPEVAR